MQQQPPSTVKNEKLASVTVPPISVAETSSTTPSPTQTTSRNWVSILKDSNEVDSEVGETWEKQPQHDSPQPAELQLQTRNSQNLDILVKSLMTTLLRKLDILRMLWYVLLLVLIPPSCY